MHVKQRPHAEAMPHRGSSPTGSEFEFDISNALAGNDFLSDAEDTHHNSGSRPPVDTGKGVNDILDASDDDDGDEAFIAAQQAASNRKGSNLKGKTVKKGGGFQQMGLWFYFWISCGCYHKWIWVANWYCG